MTGNHQILFAFDSVPVLSAIPRHTRKSAKNVDIQTCKLGCLTAVCTHCTVQRPVRIFGHVQTCKLGSLTAVCTHCTVQRPVRIFGHVQTSNLGSVDICLHLIKNQNAHKINGGSGGRDEQTSVGFDGLLTHQV